MEWTFPVTTPQRADLELPSGIIEVTLQPTDDIRVILEPMGPMSERAAEQIAATRCSCENGQLQVEVPKRKLRDVALRMMVLLPPDATLTCVTASGDISCQGDIGPFGAKTASGDVLVDGPCDLADVSTASGDVRMTSVRGEARINTASGDVYIDGIGGRVGIATASGDIRLGEVGSDVKVRTASGDIRIMQASTGDVSAQTASGDVTVGVAAGVGTWLDISTVSGSTKCNLSSEASAEYDATLRITGRTVSGDFKVEPGELPATPFKRWTWR